MALPTDSNPHIVDIVAHETEWLAILQSIPVHATSFDIQHPHYLLAILERLADVMQAKQIIWWQLNSQGRIDACIAQSYNATLTGTEWQAAYDVATELAYTYEGPTRIKRNMSMRDDPLQQARQFLMMLDDAAFAYLIPAHEVSSRDGVSGGLLTIVEPQRINIGYVVAFARQLAMFTRQAALEQQSVELEAMTGELAESFEMLRQVVKLLTIDKAWDHRIYDILNHLRNILGMSRAYTYRLDRNDKTVFKVKHETYIAGVLPPSNTDLCVVSAREFAVLKTVPKIFGVPDDFKTPLADRLQAEGVVYYLAMGIVHESELVGVFVLDDLFQTHDIHPIRSLALDTIREAIAIAMARKMALATLEAHSDDLEQRNAALKTFSSLVAHDIKAPLVRIRQDLRKIKPENIETTVNSIYYRIADLELMIKRLESLAKAYKTRALSLVETHFALTDAVNRLRPILEEDRVELIVPHTLSLTVGYQEWVTEIFYNLLLNAAESFPADHQPRTIYVAEAPSSDGDLVQLIIADTSIGFSEQQIDRLNNLFASQHSTYDQRGLGLTLVHQLVMRMGGTITLLTTPQRGSTFWFTLPRFDASNAIATGW